MHTALLILLAIGFVFLNAFFVAAEFSIVKIRNTRVQSLQKSAGISGKFLAIIHNQLDAYLSACQLGITLASLGLGWIGEPAFAKALMPVFHLLDIKSSQTITLISFLFAFGLISYLHIVAGELIPKSLAIRRTESTALLCALPLFAFYWAMYPAIWLLNASANFFLKAFRLHTFDKASHSYSSEEIEMILRASHHYGEFDKSELELLTKSLIFTDLEISDVMRPLNEMVSLDINKNLEENLQIISRKRYSRYPLYSHNPTNFIGILHIKDLFAGIVRNNVNNLTSFCRSIMKVDAEDDLLSVFHKFRKGKPHLAIVVSQGHTVGFITLDNILQAIIGEIKDEFHITKEDWVMLEDGSFIIKGSAPIFTLETLLGIELPETEVHTVSGLIFETIQSFPKEKDKIEFKDFTLIIKKIHGQYIKQVRVVPKHKNN